MEGVKVKRWKDECKGVKVEILEERWKDGWKGEKVKERKGGKMSGKA